MISVCMATYNGSSYVTEQLQTILPQLENDDEVIVVDDCSTDDTVERICRLNDLRIRVLINEQNLGVVRSFERAIGCANGDVIFLSDQDDLWMPDKVRAMSRALTEGPAAVVISDAYMLEGERLGLESFYELRGSMPGFLPNLVKNSFIGCCMAFRSELKTYVLPIPREVPMHDQWIGLMGELNGGTCFLTSRLTIYRRHENNVTQINKTTLGSVLEKRLRLLMALVMYACRRRPNG